MSAAELSEEERKRRETKVGVAMPGNIPVNRYGLPLGQGPQPALEKPRAGESVAERNARIERLKERERS